MVLLVNLNWYDRVLLFASSIVSSQGIFLVIKKTWPGNFFGVDKNIAIIADTGLEAIMAALKCFQASFRML